VIRSKRFVTVLALVAGLAMVASACGGGGSDNKSGGTTDTSSGGAPKAAGTLTVGAQQDAACADWVSNCAASAWGAYMMMYESMPRVFDYAKQNGIWTEVPNPMMAGMPEVSTVNGKQTVTYRISPAAVWSDGQPITSNDFKYTWDQIINGKDIYDPTGYDSIESIDTTDPKVAVATFKSPFASWTALFSADYGIYPSHLLEGKDRHAEMKNGYDWSGGPWLYKWRKGVDVTLTPNPKWYGQKPTIQKVVFRIITNTASLFEAFKGNQVDAIYPTSDPSAISAIKDGIPGTQSVFAADTATVEALWINNAKAPFDSKVVRQAFAYSIDRDAIVKRLFGGLGVNKAVNTLNPPIVAKYADQQAFANYTLNLNQVKTLMQGDGWTKNSDGYWEKGGKEAAFTIKSTAGDKRRELTEQILQEMLKSGGFKVSIKNPSADDLFNTMLPAGDYQVALFGSSATSLNPGLCSVLCSKYIPTKANDHTGNNTQWVSNPTLDTLLEKVDTDFNTASRIQASKQGDQVMAQEQVSLPLDPLPNIAMWSDKLSGPIADNALLSMFWNIHQWSLKG
jgi:peptide/nickel transport system substrate-binding protein